MNPEGFKEKLGSLRRILSKFTPSWYKIGLTVIAVVTVVYAINFVNEVRHARELGAQVAAMRAEQEQITRKNAELSKAIKTYKTPAFAYQKAREWGYVRTGDKPIIVSVHYLKPKPHHVHKPKPAPPAPTWQQWWHAFFG
jgi:cell division protein FtsB